MRLLGFSPEVILSLVEGTTEIGEGEQRLRVQLSLIGSANFPITASIETRSTDEPGKPKSSK